MSERPVQENDILKKGPLLVDGHVDLTYFLRRLAKDIPISALEEGPFTLKQIKEVGLRLFCNAIYCADEFNGAPSLGHLKEVLGFTLEHFDQVSVIKGRDGIEGLKKDPDRVGTLLLLENADALVGNLSFIEELMDAGVRMVGLTHRGRNSIGDGDGVLIPGGLTLEGAEVIRALNGYGLIIDVAHLHPKCFWRLLDIFDGSLINSHTGIKNVCQIQRNIDLHQVQEIIGRGGVVGITFNPAMLSHDGKANLERIFVHVDVVVQKFGPDGVGIGSDFCGFEEAAEGLEDVSKVPQLISMMLEHGYGADAVEKIMGLNWLRLYDDLFRV
jgi:membrane dipeptidase